MRFSPAVFILCWVQVRTRILIFSCGIQAKDRKVNPLHDRKANNIPKSTVGFINFVVYVSPVHVSDAARARARARALSRARARARARMCARIHLIVGVAHAANPWRMSCSSSWRRPNSVRTRRAQTPTALRRLSRASRTTRRPTVRLVSNQSVYCGAELS